MHNHIPFRLKHCWAFVQTKTRLNVSKSQTLLSFSMAVLDESHQVASYPPSEQTEPQFVSFPICHLGLAQTLCGQPTCWHGHQRCQGFAAGPNSWPLVKEALWQVKGSYRIDSTHPVCSMKVKIEAVCDPPTFTETTFSLIFNIWYLIFFHKLLKFLSKCF